MARLMVISLLASSCLSACGGDPATPSGGVGASAAGTGGRGGGGFGGGAAGSASAGRDGGGASGALSSGDAGSSTPPTSALGGDSSGGDRGGGGATTGGSSGGEALVGVFVAQGHEGRITRSCDDGRTFPFDVSADDAYRCFVDAEHDCDHSELAGRGLAFGQGSFVATWGWGHPGKLQRSSDGAAFEDVKLQTPTFADVAFGRERFVACANPTWVSSDGRSWDEGGELPFDFNYRGIEFVPTAGGKFIVTGESGEQRAVAISDDGVGWEAANAPAACAAQLRGIAGSDEVMVIASALGTVCHSSDGREWQAVSVSERFTSPPTFTGTEFVIFAGDQCFASPDGKAWSSRAVEPRGIAIGALARSPDGTWLAANDGWQVWYEKQRLYRSIDGMHWDTLPEGAFTGSHPINFMSFGYVAPSAGCSP